MRHEYMQGSSRSAAPAGTPLEEYRELRGLADSLRDRHLAGSHARSRWLSEQCSACQSISQNAHRDRSSIKCGLLYCIAMLTGLQYIVQYMCRTFSFKDLSSWITNLDTGSAPAVDLAEKLLKAQILTVVRGSESNSWSGCVLQALPQGPCPHRT